VKPFPQFCLYVVAAMTLGAVIGIERQWRNSVAGLRTNTLVAVGSAMFVLIGVMSGIADTRIAAQIVSGIGFIGGGAILREGLTIKGVNTAATLWCSAGVGALCGSGLLREAAFATGVILFANLVLRRITYRMRSEIKLRADAETHYLLQLICRAVDENRLRKVLVDAVENVSLLIRSLHSNAVEPAGMMSIRSVIESSTKQDHLLEKIVGQLCLDGTVNSISWEVVNQPGENE
jgi:putative Mg2+ transporter-C (MgtC) family protein